MSRPRMWFLSFVILVVVVFPLLHSFCKKQTDSFSVLGIQSNRPYNPNWEIRPLTREESSEIDIALSQKFHYLSRGQQSYVFLSEDQNYVIKFFNQKIYTANFLAKITPSWLSKKVQKNITRKQDKLKRDFASYKIAFNDFKDETALVLVHLNKTDFLHKKLIISDKLHIEHSLNLDEFDFILQKKAELVCPKIKKLMSEGNIEKAKQSLSSLLNLLVTRYQKGIFDSDPDFDKNFGFMGDRAVQIDIGRFNYKRFITANHFDKNASYITNRRKRNKAPYFSRKEDPPCVNEKFIVWLKKNYPDLSNYFTDELQKLNQSHAFQYP